MSGRSATIPHVNERLAFAGGDGDGSSVCADADGLWGCVMKVALLLILVLESGRSVRKQRVQEGATRVVAWLAGGSGREWEAETVDRVVVSDRRAIGWAQV